MITRERNTATLSILPIISFKLSSNCHVHIDIHDGHHCHHGVVIEVVVVVVIVPVIVIVVIVVGAVDDVDDQLGGQEDAGHHTKYSNICSISCTSTESVCSACFLGHSSLNYRISDVKNDDLRIQLNLILFTWHGSYKSS